MWFLSGQNSFKAACTKCPAFTKAMIILNEEVNLPEGLVLIMRRKQMEIRTVN